MTARKPDVEAGGGPQPLKRRWGNLAAVAGAIVITLLMAELAVRALWDDPPAPDPGIDPLPIINVRDPLVLYRLVPGSSGYYNGTRVDINSKGLRDIDYPDSPPEGVLRVLVLGDSMVFGVGLPPERTLPALLAKAIGGEAINAGVFGYNLAQQISLLRDVGLTYNPDYVVSCFVHNDIDNWGLGDGGAVPVIQSSRFGLPPQEAWSTRLATLLLPGEFDPGRLNLLPGAETGGVRGWLARHSRLYMFAYLRLRTHSWNLTSGETIDPFVASDTCQAREVIWDRLRRQYRELKEITEESGARLVVVIHGALLWRGAPLEKLMQVLEEEGISFLDLTPEWGDPAFYAREYTLGWDPHPNGRANEVAAGLIAAFLEKLEAGESPGSPPAIKKKGATVAADEEFPRYLYGFWGERPGSPPLPSPGGNVAWMSNTGSILLRRPRGAREVQIVLWLPPDRTMLSVVPGEVTFHLGVFPSDCDAGVTTRPLTGSPDGYYRFTLPIPPSLVGSPVVELRLEPGSTFEATSLHAVAPDNRASRDPRRVSFAVAGVAVR